jgi:hypothetical protein
MTGVVSVLVASVLGSVHCAGMCGGLVGFYSAGTPARPAARWAAHGAYHGTRLAAYLALGAGAGAFGAALDGAGHSLGVASLGAVCTAAVLSFFGLPALIGRPAPGRLLRLGRRRPRSLRARAEAMFGALAARARQRPPLWRAGVLGLSSALLPCGWLYAFVALAASSGSAARGTLLMGAFWSGTVPALLGLGLGVERLSRPLRAHLPRLSAALVIAAALFNVGQRWPLTALAQGGAASASCHGH